MNIKRAKEEIRNTIRAYLKKDQQGQYVIDPIRQRPVFLIGAPGIGKTQIMEQIARECKVGLVSYTITHHTRQSAIGLPFISKRQYQGQEFAVTEYTMSEIIASVYEKIETTGLTEGILFIDEINCVSETLAPAMLQFLQCKTFGNQAVPAGWIIVAAGNPPEYNRSVREFDVVTMDRLKKIEVEPDFEVWKEYAYKEQIHPAVLSYLNTKPAYFYKMETNVDGKWFATPRGWEDLSRLLQVYDELEIRADRDVIVQYIQHPKISKDFANYLELYEKYQTDYQLDAVFNGHIDEMLAKKISHAPFDERLSVVGLLLARVSRLMYLAYSKEQETGEVFSMLKEFKEGVLGVHQGQPIIYGEMLLENRKQEFAQQKKAQLLTRKEQEAFQNSIDFVEAMITNLKKQSVADGEEAFALVKEAFDSMRENLDQLEQQAAQALEYAFDFMETAFGQAGQEMVMFITELNSNFYCVRFLQENDSERYYRYNSTLLFEENHQKILKKIQAL